MGRDLGRVDETTMVIMEPTVFVGQQKMKTLRNMVIGAGVLFCLSTRAVAQSYVTPERVTKNLTGELIEIPNTRSPDGKLALFSVYLEGTTAAVAGLVTTDRQRCLAVSSSLPYGSNVRDRSPKSYLTVLWSTNSNRVAIHDSARKYSRIEIYVIDSSACRRVQLPDLFALMVAQGVVTGTARSSGEQPLQWIGDNHLLVEFRAKTETGVMVTKRLVLDLEKGIANHTTEDILR